MAFIINKNSVFIGSKQFMNYSLEKLVKNLSDNDFKYLSEEFNPKQVKLVKQKAVYPYEYMESFERFSEDKLPDKKHFHKSLKNKHISEKDYLSAVKIWNKSELKIMGGYHDLYLKTDVLLDPSYYFSSPWLSWDAMFKMIEGLREGISYISKRFTEANNKYMKNYDPTKESKYIIDLDINNLYGWGMSRYLPYGKFKWVKNIDHFDVNSISKNSLYGYNLEVDLKYPDELDNLHNDYPLAPKKLEMSYDMLSNYYQKIADKYSIKVGGSKKIIPKLNKKSNYTVHYINLQIYLSL